MSLKPATGLVSGLLIAALLPITSCTRPSPHAPPARPALLPASLTRRDSVVPRSLNRFQQLNSVKISGVPIRPLDEALRLLEGAAAGILPKGYVIDYTGESRQLRTEGTQFLPTFALAVVLIFLVLAAQFNSFRDPFVILAGSVPLAMFGALLFTFLKMPNPNVPLYHDASLGTPYCSTAHSAASLPFLAVL
jgi:multidrug efflux pump